MNIAQGAVEPRGSPAVTCRVVPMILRDVLLFGAAGFVGVSLLRFLLKLQLLWVMQSRPGTSIRLDDLISLLVITSRASFLEMWARVFPITLFGPFIETLTFVVFWRMGRWLRLGDRAFVIVSAVLWGWLHVLAKGDEYGSAFVFFCTMLSGAFLAAIYAKYRVAYDWGIAFLACAATHSLYNALIIGANFVGMKLVS